MIYVKHHTNSMHLPNTSSFPYCNVSFLQLLLDYGRSLFVLNLTRHIWHRCLFTEYQTAPKQLRIPCTLLLFSTEAFDVDEQMCCGPLTNKTILTKESSDHRCCGQNSFNPTTQCCCSINESLRIRSKDSRCCEKGTSERLTLTIRQSCMSLWNLFRIALLNSCLLLLFQFQIWCKYKNRYASRKMLINSHCCYVKKIMKETSSGVILLQECLLFLTYR